ncbi:phage major capsid protein [Microbacterium trichothecenolyticum]
MLTYPLTPSQRSAASAEEILAFVKNPTMVARRLGEILNAQQFLGYFLLSGRYDIQGGAIAVPASEIIRTERRSETVAPGGEYKLTPISEGVYEVYTAAKDGIATEVVDEEVGRRLRAPLDEAMTFLQTELVFSANELALGVIDSSVTQSIAAGGVWSTGKQIFRDALRVQAASRKLKLGFNIDTVVMNGEQYAEVLPELLDVLPKDSDVALTGSFPTISGITWVASDDDEFTDPLFLDRRRLGGIGRENIPSPEYRQVGGDTGVEIASIREPKADKTRLQARNAHVPLVVNPQAAWRLTGTAA